MTAAVRGYFAFADPALIPKPDEEDLANLRAGTLFDLIDEDFGDAARLLEVRAELDRAIQRRDFTDDDMRRLLIQFIGAENWNFGP
jgi:hypothetical protein